MGAKISQAIADFLPLFFVDTNAVLFESFSSMDMKTWVCRLHHFLEETIFYLPKSNIGSDPKLIHEIPCKS
jgi:hypothetical protein